MSKIQSLPSIIKFSYQSLAWMFLISICLAAMIIFAIVNMRENESGTLLCTNTEFEYNLNLIPPVQLGIGQWKIGDYARYRYRRKQALGSNQLLFDREATFHIVGKLDNSGSPRYWLKKKGFSYWRTFPKESYRYVTVHDLRITPENRRYDILENYIPGKFSSCNQTTIPFAKLVKLGKEKIKTEAGTFECIHYRAEFGHALPHVEIWASDAIPPLGIVRVRSETEMLDLLSFGQNTEIAVPKLIQPVIEGISTLDYGCNSCHGNDDCHESIFPPR